LLTQEAFELTQSKFGSWARHRRRILRALAGLWLVPQVPPIKVQMKEIGNAPGLNL
jgi:hypothetical protein